MKLPRDMTGNELARLLVRLGYQITRQNGSHLRLSTVLHGPHHITIPAYNPLKVGTLAAILSDLEAHHRFTQEELLRRLLP
jgi:predicted RNA binding protein YcfA (HicA-like mRNA interferase family)